MSTARVNPAGLDPIQQAVLDRRTTALARPLVTEAPGVECLVMRAAGQRYALELAAVLTTLRVTRLAPAPFAPPEVAGLTLVGSTVCPVFHLHRVLGLRTTALAEHGSLVIAGTEGATLVLAVEDAESIERLREDELLPVPEGGRTRELARGITARGIVWLDHRALLSDPRLVIDVVEREPARDD